MALYGFWQRDRGRPNACMARRKSSAPNSVYLSVCVCVSLCPCLTLFFHGTGVVPVGALRRREGWPHPHVSLALSLCLSVSLCVSLSLCLCVSMDMQHTRILWSRSVINIPTFYIDKTPVTNHEWPLRTILNRSLHIVTHSYSHST